MCKAICGVAAGACGGAINVHWSKGSDISDVMAKQGAQNTLTGSLGLVFAALFARSVSTMDELHLWSLYAGLTAVHIFANMQCMKLVAFDSLNTQRMNIVAAEFFRWCSKNQPPSDLSISVPAAIAKIEPLWFLNTRPRKLAPYPIHFGVSFNEFVRRTQKAMQEMKELANDLSSAKYIISIGTCKRRGRCVVVSLSDLASPYDQAKAYFHALLLDQTLKDQNSTGTVAEVEQSVLQKLDLAWTSFADKLQKAGWDLSKTELGSKGYEVALS